MSQKSHKCNCKEEVLDTLVTVAVCVLLLVVCLWGAFAIGRQTAPLCPPAPICEVPKW